MARSTKDGWLSGPGALAEAEVEDVPVKGQSVRVRALPAAFATVFGSEESSVAGMVVVPSTLPVEEETVLVAEAYAESVSTSSRDTARLSGCASSQERTRGAASVER